MEEGIVNKENRRVVESKWEYSLVWSRAGNREDLEDCMRIKRWCESPKKKRDQMNNGVQG